MGHKAALASVAVLFLMVATCLALPLPKYIKACKADKDLAKCAVKNGNEAWPIMVKGDPKYRLPSSDPLEVKEMVITGSGGGNVQLNLKMTDAQITGMKNLKLINARTDTKRRHIEWDINVPWLTILGNYKVDGKFLLFPINGEGPANITMVNVKATVVLDYNLEKRKGVEYMKVTKADFASQTVSRLHLKFDNLLNGDRTLGQNMNEVMNENWKELYKEMSPSMLKVFAAIFRAIVGEFLNIVPYSEIYL